MITSPTSGYGSQPPAYFKAFVATTWNRMEKAQLEQNLQQAIIDDPMVSADTATKISINLKDDSDSKSIHVLGQADSDKEAQRILEIVKLNTKEEIDVVNEMNVA